VTAKANLKRALSVIDDAASALRRARDTDDEDAAYQIRRALSELDDSEAKIKRAIRELPDEWPRLVAGNVVTLTTKAQRQLESFRQAAEQVREASIIAEGQQIRLHVRPGNPGYVDVFVQLLGNEAFRSLALALRLVYQQGEPAYFYSICNILYRAAESVSVKERVATLRSQYSAALQDPEGQVSTGETPKVSTYSTQEVFEHWLYGIAFHQDEDRQESVRLLSSEGARFQWSVQATGLKLAGRILDLDDVIADLLGQPRLPRI
jgi:hypothetical protein